MQRAFLAERYIIAIGERSCIVRISLNFTEEYRLGSRNVSRAHLLRFHSNVRDVTSRRNSMRPLFMELR